MRDKKLQPLIYSNASKTVVTKGGRHRWSPGVCAANLKIDVWFQLAVFDVNPVVTGDGVVQILLVAREFLSLVGDGNFCYGLVVFEHPNFSTKVNDFIFIARFVDWPSVDLHTSEYISNKTCVTTILRIASCNAHMWASKQ